MQRLVIRDQVVIKEYAELAPTAEIHCRRGVRCSLRRLIAPEHKVKVGHHYQKDYPDGSSEAWYRCPDAGLYLVTLMSHSLSGFLLFELTTSSTWVQLGPSAERLRDLAERVEKWFGERKAMGEKGRVTA